VDLAYRLIKLGYKVRPVPAALVYHIDHPSRNQGGQRETLNKLMGTDPVRGRPKSWS
jgi:GT2 family glycosyltransferase